MKKMMMTLACGIFSINFAQASIGDISNESPYTDKCAAKIVKALQTEDQKVGSFIGENASANVSDDLFGDKNFANVTVEEADYADGYTTWRVEVRGQDDNCEVLKVELTDVAH